MINPRPQPCDEAAILSVRGAAGCTAAAKPWVLAAAILGSSMAFIDGSVINVALPALEHSLQTSASAVQWIVNSYALALAALVLVGGAAGDRFGRRRVFVAGVGVFAAASLWCGLAPDVAQLILARAAQGIGAALLVPSSLAIIGAAFDESERGKAIGTWAGFSAIAGALGPILGGWIVDNLSWRLIFLINPVIAAPAIWIALRRLPESRDPEAHPALDWQGGALAFAGLGSLAFGLIASPERGWQDPTVMIALGAGVVLLAAFVWWELRAPAPMMPLTLLRLRVFSGINLLTLLLYTALGGMFFLLPFLLIQVHGYSATLAGAAFLPFTVIMGVLSRWSGGLLDRYGARLPLILGPVVTAVGFGLLALPGDGSYWTTYLAPVAILGLGMAVSVAPLTTAVINAVPEHQTGLASGVNNAVARVAALLAVAIFGAVVLGHYNRALDRGVETSSSATVRQAVENAKGRFVADSALAPLCGEDRRAAETVVKDALAGGIRLAMLLAVVMALAGAASIAATIPPQRRAAAPAHATDRTS